MKIYRSYYRCSICHSKITFKIPNFNEVTEPFFENLCDGVKRICPRHGEVKRIYHCRHDYWYGLLWMKIRDIIRKLK